MRRRRRHTEALSGSFGSFVDVVCNLIGGLLLIAIISALASRDPIFHVFSPIEDVRSEDARSTKFAVTEKGIYPLDQSAALRELVAAGERNPNADTLAVATRFFKWILYRDQGLMICKLSSTTPPITEANIDAITSDRMLDPETGGKDGEYFAYFMVSPSDEAFRLFRMARKALWRKGVRVGWAPRDPRKDMVFGGRGDGVRMRPQD